MGWLPNHGIRSWRLDLSRSVGRPGANASVCRVVKSYAIAPADLGIQQPPKAGTCERLRRKDTGAVQAHGRHSTPCDELKRYYE